VKILGKRKAVVLLALVVGLIVTGAVARKFVLRKAAPLERNVSTGDARTSPADARIRAAEEKIRQSPNSPDGYNLLAAAYAAKARETGDFGLNAKAEEALTRSFEIEPDNYNALKLRARLLLTYHRFAEARDVARRAQAMQPRDHDVYGALTDALVELGEYEAATVAAQTMINLRPDAASYARVSYLRELHGDLDGAIEAMRTAVKATSLQDAEHSAWARVQLGKLLLNVGDVTGAESEFDYALRLVPDYYLALDGKAKARIAMKDFDKAVEIYKQERARNPSSADAALALGELYSKMGRTSEAAGFYEQFESLERSNAVAENDWHHLVYFWTDQNKNLDEALTLAQRARAERSDVHTCDALAWALFKKGRLEEANAAMNEALRLGSRDPQILYHAGLIQRASAG
jgi:tetratricopeptide (TPR) repeat protein